MRRADGAGQDLGHVDDFEVSLASPELFLALTASPSMTRQYGQPVEMVSGSVPSASSIRSVLIRLPIRSSIHIRAPPAPQQNPRFLHRCISCGLDAGHRSMISRGGVKTLLCLAEETRVVVGDLLLDRASTGVSLPCSTSRASSWVWWITS